MDTLKIDSDLLKGHPLPDWDETANKATRGKLLLVAGSSELPGAAILAARAALRAGCGTVRLAAPAPVALAIGVAVPELRVIALPVTAKGGLAPEAADLILAQAQACDAAVMGPGLDESAATAAVAARIISELPLPLAVDAAALAAWPAETKGGFPAARVVTPHDAEYATLSGAAAPDEEDAAARAAAATAWAKAGGAVLALKGRATLVVTPEGEAFHNEAGNRALGTAGSGDVLAGVLGSLLAQGLSAPDAAIWAVHMHALAAEAIVKDVGEDGVLARDFVDRLPQVQKYLRKALAPRTAGGFGLRPN